MLVSRRDPYRMRAWRRFPVSGLPSVRHFRPSGDIRRLDKGQDTTSGSVIVSWSDKSEQVAASSRDTHSSYQNRLDIRQMSFHSPHPTEWVTVLLSTISGFVPSMLVMNAVNNPIVGKNISHRMLSVSIASDPSEEFLGDVAGGYQSGVKRPGKAAADHWGVREFIMSVGPLLFAPLLALLLKGGAIAKGAAVAKGAAAATSATLAKGAAATKTAATALAA